MARFDHVDSTIGNFRARAAADADPADYDKVLACGLNASGRVVTGAAGNSGFVGVTTVDRTKRKTGEVLDIMTNGEIVECAGLTAATKYYVQADGTLGSLRSEIYVGHTVEADRLVVRFQAGEDA